MRIFCCAVAGLSFAIIASAPATAAPLHTTAPAVASARNDVQRVCHHYRWSSRRHCTSAKALQFRDRRPALHYPHKYYGGTPHYAQRFYWHAYPYYRYHRWFHSPYRWPYRYPYWH